MGLPHPVELWGVRCAADVPEQSLAGKPGAWQCFGGCYVYITNLSHA